MAAVKNEIYIGDRESPLLYFSNVTIISSSGEYAVDLVGNELSVDRFDPVVKYTFYAQQRLISSDGYSLETADGYILYGYWNENPEKIPYGTECWHYLDGELSAKLYVDYIEKVSADGWKIHAMSVIGLLDLQPHRGGVYMGKSFAELLTEFFGGTVGESKDGLTPITGGITNCLVEDAVASTTVHGLLPYSESKRDNLHQLMFAYCVNMTKNANGDLLFTYLRSNPEPPIIPQNRTFVGGQMAYEQPITSVELTEYTYIFDESVEPEEIYDNTSAPHTAGEALIVFNTPINPDTITTSEPTMIVRDANEVSAYVTGHGIISAKPYQVQERIISKSSETAGVEKTVSVDGVTLVNPLNSTNLMTRLFAYYTQRKTVRTSILVTDEKPGDLCRFYNPYYEIMSGFIHRMQWSTTSFTRSNCEIITGYTPPGISTNMQNVVLLTGTGEWTVPAGVTKIRAVLMAGGQGGGGGYPGEDSERNPEKPGAGGEPGIPGKGGRVLTREMEVTPGQRIAFSCGIGGVGGNAGEEGMSGTDTIFGEDSTFYGAVAPGGIMNLIDGKFYARQGNTGIAGAAGGKGAAFAGTSPTPDELASLGMSGEALTYKDQTWDGGQGGAAMYASQNGYTGWALGGGGGGAAMGANGNNGTDGHVEWRAVIGGIGGEGATASIPGAAARYTACGGDAGHGGGGGGAPGKSGFSGGSAPIGYVGKGGLGSVGGKGADGGILIYF